METVIITAKEQALQHAASKDATRYNINAVEFNHGHAVATDGRMMAIRRLVEEDAPRDKLIKFSSPKLKGKSCLWEQDERRVVGIGNPANWGEVIDRESFPYPNWKQLTVGYECKDRINIGLDAGLLKRLADALCSDGKLYLSIPKNGTDPIVCYDSKDTDAVGILMPVRYDEKADPITVLNSVAS